MKFLVERTPCVYPVGNRASIRVVVRLRGLGVAREVGGVARSLPASRGGRRSPRLGFAGSPVPCPIRPAQCPAQAWQRAISRTRSSRRRSAMPRVRYCAGSWRNADAAPGRLRRPENCVRPQARVPPSSVGRSRDDSLISSARISRSSCWPLKSSFCARACTSGRCVFSNSLTR